MSPSPTAAAWREAVLELRYAERRRVFPATVHVGLPGGARAAHELPDRPGRAPWDHALRADVLGALLDRYVGPAGPTRAGGGDGVPLCWVTRGGPPTGHDEDLAWLAAARATYAEAGLDLALAVVTHGGWYDPATGEGRTWKRLRRVPARSDTAGDTSRQSQAWTGSLECMRSR